MTEQDQPEPSPGFQTFEAVADAVSLETNQLIGRAKDLGSAAVFLSLLLCALLWLVLFANHWLAVI